jgi:hypothetical protein
MDTSRDRLESTIHKVNQDSGRYYGCDSLLRDLPSSAAEQYWSVFQHMDAAAPIVFVAGFAFTDDCMGGHSPCPHADDVKEGGDLLEFANDCLLLFR